MGERIRPLLSLLLLAGCRATAGDPDAPARDDAKEEAEEPTREAAAPVTATTVGEAKAAVVYLQFANLEAQTLDTCTGILVAPNLVATARHCVALRSAEPATCESAATSFVGTVNGGRFLGDIEPGTIIVSQTGDRPSTASGTSVAGELLLCSAVSAIGHEIIDSKAPDLCAGEDIAFLVLDRDIPLPAYPTFRSSAPVVGERVTAFGWGNVASDGAPTTAMKEMPLEVLAAAEGAFPADGCVNDEGELRASVVAPNEVVFSPGQFKGDSGGPVVDEAGQIVSLHSRQVAQSSGGGTCPGYGIGTRTDGRRALARAAELRGETKKATADSRCMP